MRHRRSRRSRSTLPCSLSWPRAFRQSSNLAMRPARIPFVKVKSLTTDLINKLQDTLERLDRNHLAENDELGFEQACVSEHFPEKRGRNLNPESEVFMARIFQIWVNHSRSLGPGSKSRQFSGETNRPRQSKQRQVWVRFEGQTKAVDVGGTEEEVRKRIQTAIGGTRE